MHDDVLARLDDHLAELALLRAELVRARSVRPGERHTALLRALQTSELFVREMTRLLARADARGAARQQVVTTAP